MLVPPESRSQEIHRESVALREYFEALRQADLDAINRRFVDAEKAVQSALAAADKAVNKAEIASEKRADASNEIRGAMIDAQAQFWTKVEGFSLERRVVLLEEAINRAAGKSAGVGLTTGAIYAFIGAAAAVIAAIAIIKPFN